MVDGRVGVVEGSQVLVRGVAEASGLLVRFLGVVLGVVDLVLQVVYLGLEVGDLLP